MELFDKVKELKETILAELNKVNSMNELKAFQEKHLSKKSELSGIMSHIKELNGEDKAKFGQLVNEARNEVNEGYKAKLEDLSMKEKLYLHLKLKMNLKTKRKHMRCITIMKNQFQKLSLIVF